MFKQREVVTEDVNKETETLRNIFDTVTIIENPEATKNELMIPYCNGQISTLQMTLQGDIEPETRYKTLVKLTAYFTYMLELIKIPDPVIEEEPNEDFDDPFPT